MLVSLYVQNSRSILSLVVPMTYGERKAPNGYKEMETYAFLEEGGLRTIPTLALYGANASGKSNIIRAFHHLVALSRGHFRPNEYAPNRLHPVGQDITYTVEFFSMGHLFRYMVALDGKEIVAEALSCDGRPLFHVTEEGAHAAALATRDYPESRLATIFEVECLDGERRQRATFLSVLGKNYAGLSTRATAAFGWLSSGIEVYLDTRWSFSHGLETLARQRDCKGVQHACDRIAAMLRKLDIDIKRMEYKQNLDDVAGQRVSEHTYEYAGGIGDYKTHTAEIYSYHTGIDGKDVRFEFSEESAGTQRVACLLGVILSALGSGTVLVVDELGTSLHPLLLGEIIRLFKDKRYNTTNAQLIFTTHNTEILDQDLLRISEIGIVNKTLTHGTTLSRVCDFEGVRNVTNFRKQYLEGRFRGIPFPYI